MQFAPHPHRATTIAITGGIGSGKSHVCRLLEADGAPIFYTDAEAKRIIRTHPDVGAQLRALVGPEVYDADGQLVKSVLAQFLCRGREYSQQVDAIVHPRVAEAWHAFVEAHAHHTYIYMECAILFETGFDRWVDHTLAILCPLEVRIARIMARDHIDRATALRWSDLQMPDEQKAARATATLINDGQADVALQLHQLGLR